jgi:hypothetical protein
MNSKYNRWYSYYTCVKIVDSRGVDNLCSCRISSLKCISGQCTGDVYKFKLLQVTICQSVLNVGSVIRPCSELVLFSVKYDLKIVFNAVQCVLCIPHPVIVVGTVSWSNTFLSRLGARKILLCQMCLLFLYHSLDNRSCSVNQSFVTCLSYLCYFSAHGNCKRHRWQSHSRVQ